LLKNALPLPIQGYNRFSLKYKEDMLMKEKVEKKLEQIRPSLQADGGDVELVDVSDDGIVQVKLTGACAGCPMSTLTLKNGIERLLKQEIPEVKEVQAV
jgi:Fe-S cluster biogenesis protein NfuA